MTRKDYELIAAAIKGAKCVSQSGEYDRGARTQKLVTAIDIADALERDNRRFNRSLFLAACGCDE